jgi:hypothetical protein
MRKQSKQTLIWVAEAKAKNLPPSGVRCEQGSSRTPAPAALELYRLRQPALVLPGTRNGGARRRLVEAESGCGRPDPPWAPAGLIHHGKGTDE